MVSKIEGAREFISDRAAVLAIHRLLDRQEWSSDTLDRIASVLREAGYSIRDHNDVEVP